MISCTEFIMVYNELFKFLEEAKGREEVVRYWKALSDSFRTDLQEKVKKEGLKGMKDYYDYVLQSENADYTINITEDKLEMFIRECPSVGILHRSRHIRPYRDYCGHCAVLYARATDKKFGLTTTVDFINRDKGYCRRLVVRKKAEDSAS